MSAGANARTSLRSSLLRLWRDPAAWARTADIFAILVAFSLPWSTSLVSIFAAAWLVTVAVTLDLGVFLQSLKRPICALPIAIFVLALAGTLWSDGPWGTRFYGVGPTLKLLMLPLLLYHYQRSPRGLWVLTAFLISCVLMLPVSWAVLFDPALSLKAGEGAERGIFVKNYIDQGQEFALCAVGLAFPIVTLLRAGKIWPALGLAAIALSFFVNMAFVIVSRTALVTIPVLLLIFALLHLRWRGVVAVLLALIALGGLAFAASPQLRATAATFLSDYRLYKEAGRATSIGERLEFFQKSVRFFAAAPVAGHGTGSTRRLFEQAAVGDASLASSKVVSNPHNQTLNVAVQWGVIGVALLYAMWLFHLMLFRGDGLVASIGLLVVLQNILTSLFNSHLFDFHEGWMYVLGVGVAGGMTLAANRRDAPAEPAASR
jgi:O-antigen ligase